MSGGGVVVWRFSAIFGGLAVPLVLPNQGLIAQLSLLLKDSIMGVDPLEFILFQNDYIPVQTSVWADLTEATFMGYSRVTVTRSDWTSPVIVANKAVSTWKTVGTSWTNTSSTQTIFGFALITPVTPVIRVVERFVSPVVLANGGVITVLPTYNFTTAP